MTKVICPYCRAPARQVFGTVIYPHRSDLHGKTFYLCKLCNAYVGCHPGTTSPLGRLANATLRSLKSQAHNAFDPIWRSGEMTRHEAYAWLSSRMGLAKSATHIGMFDDVQCQQVIAVCAARGME